MAKFRFKAARPSGEVETGILEAHDAAAAVQRVQSLGLIPIRLDISSPDGDAPSGRRWFSRAAMSRDQLGAVTRELATLLRSGLPLDRALEIVGSLAAAPAMRTLIERLREDVRGGAALSKAMEAHPRVFDRFYIGMVRAGEAGGMLGPVLSRIAEFMERSKELRETVMSALIYPSILILASVTSVMLLLIFVVPQFAEMFQQSGKALPLPTQIVIGAGEWLRQYWWAIPLAAVLLYRYFLSQMKRPERKRVWDARLLRLPLAGDLALKIEVARFSRTLSTLLGNGIPLLPALGIVRETVSNSVVEAGLAAARDQLQAGLGLSRPLLSQGIFPPLAIHMIGVGEETGRLEEMLGRIADIYDREVTLAVKRMLALLEPTMILGLGVLIGGIILSILLAILRVNSLVG